MSVNSTGRGCQRKRHQGDAARRMAIYDSLPREVRDQLKIARNNLCAGCVRDDLRRGQRHLGEADGLKSTLLGLKLERTTRTEKRGREIWYIREEDLKP